MIKFPSFGLLFSLKVCCILQISIQPSHFSHFFISIYNSLKLTLIFLLCFSFQCKAQNVNETVDIDLITISPGEYYWSAFGHTAIRIKSLNYDKIFGFGYFDFEKENFFINFAKGEMQYFLGVVDSDLEIENYKRQGRSVISQKLTLTTVQKEHIINELTYLSREENRYYPYNYFLNNCTSKIRDILNDATNGEVNLQLAPIATDKSWNDLTFPMKNQTWMNLGIAFVYGLSAFEKKNKWQLSVFPEVLSTDIKNIETRTGWNNHFSVIHTPSKQESAFSEYSFIKTHYAVILCVLVLLIGITLNVSSKPTIILWLITQSLLGVILILLWFLTSHTIAKNNINLLIMFPMAFIFMFQYFRKSCLLNVYLLVNLVWIIAALFLTNLYLIGFCLVNLLMILKLKKLRAN